MKRFNIKLPLVSLLILFVLILMGCGPATPTTPTVPTTPTAPTTPTTPTAPTTPTTPTTAAPRITITLPTGNSVLQVGAVSVTVSVSNFKIINNLSKPNVAGEGHIHYFLDVDPPTTPGQPAVTANGTYAATASTNYTWQNVGAGAHKFSVELVNNNHTPLTPPVVASVNVTVQAGTASPIVTILMPAEGSTVTADKVNVYIQASNFNVVDKQGQANVAGEGHIHYFLDVDAPTTAGQPAIPASGVWAHVASTNYTFTGVTAGAHSISVELVNNDHTPLTSPAVAKVNFNVAEVSPISQTVTVNLTAQNFAFDKSSITVPAGANVTINFENKDSVPHNFAVYTNANATSSIFPGQIITGPSSVTYNFKAPTASGSYFFRCDVHPSMTGTFIVR